MKEKVKVGVLIALIAICLAINLTYWTSPTRSEYKNDEIVASENKELIERQWAEYQLAITTMDFSLWKDALDKLTENPKRDNGYLTKKANEYSLRTEYLMFLKENHPELLSNEIKQLSTEMKENINPNTVNNSWGVYHNCRARDLSIIAIDCFLVSMFLKLLCLFYGKEENLEDEMDDVIHSGG